MTTPDAFTALLNCRVSQRWQAMASLHAELNAAGVAIRFDKPRERGSDAALYAKAKPLFAAWLACSGRGADALAMQLDHLGVIVRRQEVEAVA